MKQCYICGKRIEDDEPYYSVGPNSYICANNECYNIHWWDKLSARYVTNVYHEYLVVDNKLYSIGADEDEPRGFGGKHWIIEFFDGVRRETNSLWFLADIPEDKKHIFKENARFLKGQKL